MNVITGFLSFANGLINFLAPFMMVGLVLIVGVWIVDKRNAKSKQE